MNSRIEQSIEEIQEYIDSCKYQTFSNTKIIVDKEEITNLVNELRLRTPEEIKRYAKIVSNKEAILNDARQKAQQLIDEATIKTNELISEHEIMQKAYEQANEYVSMAAQKAQKILDDAANDANEMREGARKYAEDMLTNMDTIISHSMMVTKEQSEAYLNAMKECHDIVNTNLSEIKPKNDSIDDFEEALLKDDNED